MSTPNLGARLAQLCARATGELVLCAPFIKAATLKRLLEKVAPGVTVRCITRWRPEEIVAGVSDLEVWPLLQARPDSTLWLCPHLHAKFYRADAECLLGSANLTAKALGWAPQSNLELLLALPASHPTLSEWEAVLWGNSSQADHSIHDQMERAVELFRISNPSFAAVASSETSETAATSSNGWLPATRNPSDLYALYSGQIRLITDEGRRTAPDDLAFFGVPAGLDKAAFNVYVGALLLQQNIVRAVDVYVQIPRAHGEIESLLNSLPCANDSAFEGARTLETLLRWLPYFLPDRYQSHDPNEEVLARR